ncbi:MAG: EscU/YscU/HrcU family type III secretion system export apparatus switch protein [Candidatus Magnetobacterium sp. LHC-1]|uniref:EscU/YscU/HrcU family type III secretion system export apparatus switch protein n=1 Tax=Candidatus Magnetobacterium casense TaxID=1455061 RepID=A0ABS6RV74_9BACT|nr:EscU/YscU/HrcU family type III secretion system export apparatus switch protein [Candidatus Magnetobacterium casensis]MBF0606443.1 EscU/YscU/HrcU family type III secretion system export apparatus switch protein [Nitrospirota bacterium]MBV6340531.1 EscU/YscU/HrcU family type III secretion system export apparatus switch protein [Candidatus Magnetobacterium casensis]
MNEKPRKAAALKYKPGVPGAPRLVAKGAGTVADKIVEMAQASGIPVTEDRQLIEILSALDLYQEIPYDLYKAVAEILAFVYSISKKA